MSVSTRHQVTRLAMQIGLATNQPPRSASAVVRARTQQAAKLLAAPGPLYFSASLLGSLIAAFLVGLWLL